MPVIQNTAKARCSTCGNLWNQFATHATVADIESSASRGCSDCRLLQDIIEYYTSYTEPFDRVGLMGSGKQLLCISFGERWRDLPSGRAVNTLQLYVPKGEPQRAEATRFL
jgi:hypothetical protein